MISLKGYLVLYFITVVGTFIYHKSGIEDRMSEITDKKIKYSSGSIIYLIAFSTISGFFNNFLVVGLYVCFYSFIGEIS